MELLTSQHHGVMNYSLVADSLLSGAAIKCVAAAGVELELSWSMVLSLQLLVSRFVLEVVLFRFTCFTSHLQWARGTHRVCFYVQLTSGNMLPQGLLLVFYCRGIAIA